MRHTLGAAGKGVSGAFDTVVRQQSMMEIDL